MKFGLTDSEFTFLKEHLIETLKKHNAKVFIFGSRTTGKHHKFSDIDLLFVEDAHHPVSESTITKILTFFEDSNFPYKIDLVNNRTLAQSYRKNVEASCVEI